MPETTLARPECDATAIQSAVQTTFHPDPAEAAFRCGNCGAQFDEPVEREKQRTGGRRGLAGTLAAEDTELATDGGALQ